MNNLCHVTGKLGHRMFIVVDLSLADVHTVDVHKSNHKSILYLSTSLHTIACRERKLALKQPYAKRVRGTARHCRLDIVRNLCVDKSFHF